MNRNLLEKLLAAYGPSGNEGAVRAALEDALRGHVDSLSTDALGNLIAVQKGDGTGKRIMLSAHMDHIGLIVIDADKHGYLRVCAVGGVKAENMISAHVVFESGVEGVIDAQPVKDGKRPAVGDLFIDIGAQDREEALSRVEIGDMCVMKPRVTALGEHRISSPALDDRVACFVQAEALLALKKTGCKNEIVAVFSAQEEVGSRGARTAAYALQPDLGIVIDVTGTGDTPGVKPRLPMKLGGGAAVKIMDSYAISTPWVVQMMLDEAQKANIPVQREVLPYGGTDADVIQQSRAGVPVGVISIPCRYIHSAAETVDLRDVQAALDLLLACVRA